ncbi:MAG: ABC transporter transmembrane domain-containing protein [Alphaproteobacteria bacterium]
MTDASGNSGAVSGKTSRRPGTRTLAPLRRVFPFLAPYKLRIFGAVIAVFVAAGTVLAFGQGLRQLVDKGFNSHDPALLDQALIVMLVFVVVLAAATASRFYLVAWIGERVVADIRRAVYSHVLSLSPAFFESTRTGEVLSRLTNDTTLVQTVIGSQASVAARNALMLIGGIAMLIVTSPKLTLLISLIVPAVVLSILFFGRKVRKLSRATQDRVADVSDYIEESLNAIRIVQAFGHEDLDRASFAARVEQAFAIATKRINSRAFLTGFATLMAFGATGVVLWIGGQDVFAGKLTAGQLSAFVFYAALVAGAVGSLSEFMGDLQQAAGAIERLMELLATKSDVEAPARPLPFPERARGAVAFRGVTFRYPTRPDDAALENFSLLVAPGETVAMVGPSGAGKTTVFQLLLRFYDPQSGAITLDDVVLKDADPRAIRARIGLVPQDPVIFSGNAWDNIRYGRPEASDADVRAAADAAAASEFLDRLPEGFDTHLGARGVTLSGGQRQRVAIARAILRNPSVLLLDEATSALDAESERMVQVALGRLMNGRTTLVIAHRLATVLKAGRIVVMDRGRIVDIGSHEQLIARCGLYARLAELQFNAPALAGLSAQADEPPQPVSVTAR